MDNFNQLLATTFQQCQLPLTARAIEQDIFTDWNSVLAAVVLALVLVIVCLTFWVNSGGSISVYVAQHGVQQVISLGNPLLLKLTEFPLFL